MAFGLDPEQTLENILFARAYNSDHQYLIIDELFKACPKQNVKLVVVDSMISHFGGEKRRPREPSVRLQIIDWTTD